MVTEADSILLAEINKIKSGAPIDSLNDLEESAHSTFFEIVHFFVNRNARSPKAFKMPESTLALFRLASKFASQLTDMGYPHQVGVNFELS